MARAAQREAERVGAGARVAGRAEMAREMEAREMEAVRAWADMAQAGELLSASRQETERLHAATARTAEAHAEELARTRAEAEDLASAAAAVTGAGGVALASAREEARVECAEMFELAAALGQKADARAAGLEEALGASRMEVARQVAPTRALYI